MNDTEKHKMCKAENYEYESDFQLLTLKEKRGILKNARVLLNIQKKNNISHSPLPQAETDAFLLNGRW